jgi:hypothetical protein
MNKSFFISYNKADKSWAEWIAWTLEDNGYTTIIQAWDFLPGSNFVLEIQKATTKADCVVALLSQPYLDAVYTHAEWASAFVRDPKGDSGNLLPIKVGDCLLEGILASIIYVDLANLNEAEAAEKLLAAATRKRTKPINRPSFPKSSGASLIEKPLFPTTETPFQRGLPPIWGVPHHRNPNFIGRDGLLDEIGTSIASTQTPAVVQALRGLGGVGKTQLAVEYAYRYAHKYSCVWWLRSEETSTLTTDYISLGKSLGLSVESVTDQLEAVRIVRRWLEVNAGWLLIFDNAIDASSVRRFLPQGATGHTIITSRNPSWKGLGHTLSIGVLKREDSVSFILQVTGQTDSSTASELASALGDLPLALSQAMAYIERTGILLTKYLELFRLRRREVQQQEAPPEDYPDTVATTWLINIQIIKSQFPAAIDLLNLISFWGPEAIPLSLLKRKPSLLPTSLSNLVKDDLKINNAIVSLRAYSLLEIFGESISLHRLVQAITRDHLSKEQAENWAAAAIEIVRASFPMDSDKIETRDTSAHLLPHALASASHATRLNIEQKAASWLLNQVGMHLMLIGNYEEAESILRRALDIADGKIGDTEYDRPR